MRPAPILVVIAAARAGRRARARQHRPARSRRSPRSASAEVEDGARDARAVDRALLPLGGDPTRADLRQLAQEPDGSVIVCGVRRPSPLLAMRSTTPDGLAECGGVCGKRPPMRASAFGMGPRTIVMKTTSFPSRTARCTVWRVTSRRSVMTGSAGGASGAVRRSVRARRDERPDRACRHRGRASAARRGRPRSSRPSTSADSRAGPAPRRRALRRVRRRPRPRHPIEHADRFGPVRGAHVATRP